ncbi:hypothetical protein AVEN_240477-1 [Araneus ventricosus]|uniref:Uncharacterized protein n=1 Tax=Araneus ventricosus TaxID=182803 RepID=A0A4Y2VNK1_ARAVE|nr:hypothetical protein AVEN_240477-1 [Araneus ventricosus]
MEILEHGKKKTIVKVENLWKNSIVAGKTWVSNQTKFQAFLRRFFKWDLYSRVATDQSVCLEWDLASRLPNQNSAEWGGNRGIEDR